jgi:hypothetical protein
MNGEVIVVTNIDTKVRSAEFGHHTIGLHHYIAQAETMSKEVTWCRNQLSQICPSER